MHGFRSRAADIGRARWDDLARRYGRELRLARMTSGLTQRDLARLAGVSQQVVSRAELGDPGVALEIRCRLAAACGHEVAVRLFPVSTVTLRDSGQLSIAQTLIAAARPPWSHRLEVPVGQDDRRAADVLFAHPEEVAEVEIERALVDFQAQLRAGQLKRDAIAAREGRPVRLVIAAPDSQTVRQRLRPFSEVIARTLPASSRRVWQSLRSGRPIGADGLVFVRTSGTRDAGGGPRQR
jgi:transcriptional regulator with XRE-family HTH domain